jgi:nucleoside-specific outer membrane channel protein Tsx
LLGRDFSFGPIKDVLLATTYELGEGDVESYLVRPEFDLAAPGFDFFQLNFYYRKLDGDRVPNGALQVTPAWSYTNPVGNSSLLIMASSIGSFNNAPAHGGDQSDYHANFHFNPQIKYDLGKS